MLDIGDTLRLDPDSSSNSAQGKAISFEFGNLGLPDVHTLMLRNPVGYVNEIPLWNSVEMHDMKIGSRIRAERESQGISRTELAKFAGIATSTLSDLELGHSRSTTALHKIAERLGVSAQWLETGRGEKSTDTFPAPIGNNSLGYVRVQQMGEAGMGDGRENEDFPEIVRTVEYWKPSALAAWIPALLGVWCSSLVKGTP